MEDWRAVDILCPYYKSISGSKRAICCEGIAEQTSIATRFPCRAALDAYINAHCAQLRSSCAIRRALDAKYEALE